MLVSTPTDKSVVTSKWYKSCLLVIEGRTFLVDLLCLPLPNLDLVLGKGWLLSNHVLFDCKCEAVSFEQTQSDVLTSELKAKNTERRLRKEPVRMCMISIL